MGSFDEMAQAGQMMEGTAGSQLSECVYLDDT
jgi:hypothetical protein